MMNDENSMPMSPPTAEVEPAEVMNVEPVPMQPVQLGERIELMDILRGFALFGILCVNMQFYTTPLPVMNAHPPYWPEWYDRLATGFIEAFCSGKFYILFSFLFGMGISIQLVRADQRGQPFAGYHLRRMMALLGFGLGHAFFIWIGDVLTTYALLGFLFLLFVRRKNITLWIVAVISYLLPLLVVSVFVGVFLVFQHVGKSEANAGTEAAKAWEKVEEGLSQARVRQAEAAEKTKVIYSSGSYGEVTALRAKQLVALFPEVILIMWPTVLAMFLLGLWTGRRGILANPEPYLRFFRNSRWFALALGLTGNLLFAAGSSLSDMNNPNWLMLLAYAGLTFGAPALTFFYVTTIILLAREVRWQSWLRLLGCVGRMALTNYLLQSLICSTIFYSHGLGLYADVGPLGGLGLTVLIYAVQIPFSVFWLRYFRFGPMEWLWRTLTYGKPQPMRL